MLEVKTDFLEKELNVIKHVDEHYGGRFGYDWLSRRVGPKDCEIGSLP